MNKKLFILFNFLILIISTLDYKTIPFYDRLGLDFSNQYGFHHCKDDSKTIYKTPAIECPDFEARPYIYPPLLYVFFSWTRLFDSVDYAYYFFIILYVISFLAIIYIWSDKNIPSILFGLGLFITLPSLFLMERGNSDLFITLAWSLGYFFYSRKKHWKAGFFIAFSVFAKLYPVYGLIVLSGNLIRNFVKNVDVVKSFIVSTLIILFITPYLWFIYIFDVLPKWMNSSLPLMNITHSLKALPSGGGFLFLVILLLWFLASYKVNPKNIGIIWSGCLAIATFNNGVSYDYNLVTFFPFAIFMFNYLRKSDHIILEILFLTACSFVFGSRSLFDPSALYLNSRVYFLAFFFIITPFVVFDLSFDFRKIIKLLTFNLKVGLKRIF